MHAAIAAAGTAAGIFLNTFLFTEGNLHLIATFMLSQVVIQTLAFVVFAGIANGRYATRLM